MDGNQVLQQFRVRCDFSWLAFNMLLGRSWSHSLLMFLSRLKVKEEVIALQRAACQETRGSAVPHRSVSPCSRARSFLGLINIFQPAYGFGSLSVCSGFRCTAERFWEAAGL